MLAARITRHGGPEALELAEVPVPSPAGDEVLVEVRAAALNNTDLWTREGAYGLPGDPDARAGWRGPLTFPRIQGADVAGTVVESGSGDHAELVGHRVVVDPAAYDSESDDANPVALMGSEWDGGYAEFVAVPARRVHVVDDSPLSEPELASLPTAYGTALGMIERGRLRTGDTVLVTGASGGVGLALVQLARSRGARVVAISSGTKLEQVRDAGADHVVDRGADLWPAARDAAPDGFDLVLDVVAGSLLGDGLPTLREGARWVVAGALGGHDVDIDVRRLYLHNLALVGSSMHTPAHFAALMEIARRGEVHPVVAATLPLTEVHRAQAQLAEREHVGKIVLTP